MNTKGALRVAFSGLHLRRALVVAAVVGTALNLINQPDVLLAGAAPHWPKLLLTYCVPFLVVSYGTFATLRES